MYKSERRLFEEVYLLAGLCILSEATSDRDLLRLKVEAKIDELLIQSGKNRTKIERRVARTNEAAGILNMVASAVHGHKFILIWHRLAELLIERGWGMTQEIIDQYEPFLVVENGQDKCNSEWVSMKSSADKQALKLLNKLNNLGLYTI